jgi:hypothetical protein
MFSRDKEVKMSLLFIQSAKTIEEYVLELSFSDGVTIRIDFEPFLSQSQHPEIRKYLDFELFETYSIVEGDLMWGDYDLVFPIDQLHSGEFSRIYSWNAVV